MRKTIVLSCLIGLGISFALVALKKTAAPEAVEQKQAVAPQSDPPPSPPVPAAVINVTNESQAEQHFPEAGKTGILTNLLAQIQAGLKSDDSADHMRVFNELLPALVRIDPRAAAALAESPDAGNWQSEMMRVVAQTWAETNRDDAINWASQIATPGERDAAVSHVCLQAGEKDPAWAIQTLEQNGAGDYQPAMLENLAQRWAQQDFSAAAAWAGNYPAGEERDKLFARIAFAQSQVAPEDAAWTVVREIPSGPVQNEAAFSVLNQWGMKDMPGALSWAEQFPAGDLFERAQNQLEGITLYQSGTN